MSISYCYWHSQHRILAWPWNLGWKSVKFIKKLGYGFLFAFHSNSARICSRFDRIHERDRQTPHDGI